MKSQEKVNILFMKKSFIALVAVLTSCGAFAAENLALNKTYTMSRKPNYKLTTNDTDNIELTDGKFSRGSRIWTSKNTTVGWTGSQQVTITIDLGSVQPICGAMWSTAGGHAGVKWPDFINVFVSDDGKQWYLLGDLRKQVTPPEMGKLNRCKFNTKAWKAKGRYVAFQAQNAYLFCDELQVFKGTPDMLQADLSPLAIQSLPVNYTAPAKK